MANGLLFAVAATPALSQEVAPVMPMAGVAAAPAGFLDYCEREPLACADAGETPSVEAVQARRRDASRLYWATLFGTAAPTLVPAAAPPARAGVKTVEHPRMRLMLGAGPIIEIDFPRPSNSVAASLAEAGAPSIEDATDAFDDVSQIGAGIGAMAAADVSTSSVVEREVGPVERAVFTLDKQGWALVNGVNRRINRAIRRTSDINQYGRQDVWAAPTGRGARGDCEDYVLAKRQELIAEGVPAETLSIAVVETRWGEGHAVLLIASDRGEFVLDSLSPWVERWDRVDYHWVERQVSGKAFDWVRINA